MINSATEEWPEMKQPLLSNAIVEPPAVPMRCGGHLYWEAQCKNVVLEDLGHFLPNAAYKSGIGDSFKTEFSLFEKQGTDICSEAEALTSPKVKISRSELKGFISALDRFHKRAEAPNTPDWAREFIRTFSIPDPRFVPNAWRIGSRSGRLFVLWGYHPGNARDVVRPLTPTSSNWPDAENRIDLLLHFEREGRISSSVSRRAFFRLGIPLVFAGAVLFAVKKCMAPSGERKTDIEKSKEHVVVTNSIDVLDRVFVTNTITMTNIVERIHTMSDSEKLPDRKTISKSIIPDTNLPVAHVVQTNTVVVTELQYITNWINIPAPKTERPMRHVNGRGEHRYEISPGQVRP